MALRLCSIVMFILLPQVSVTINCSRHTEGTRDYLDVNAVCYSNGTVSYNWTRGGQHPWLVELLQVDYNCSLTDGTQGVLGSYPLWTFGGDGKIDVNVQMTDDMMYTCYLSGCFYWNGDIDATYAIPSATCSYSTLRTDHYKPGTTTVVTYTPDATKPYGDKNATSNGVNLKNVIIIPVSTALTALVVITTICVIVFLKKKVKRAHMFHTKTCSEIITDAQIVDPVSPSPTVNLDDTSIFKSLFDTEVPSSHLVLMTDEPSSTSHEAAAGEPLGEIVGYQDRKENENLINYHRNNESIEQSGENGSHNILLGERDTPITGPAESTEPPAREDNPQPILKDPSSSLPHTRFHNIYKPNSGFESNQSSSGYIAFEDDTEIPPDLNTCTRGEILLDCDTSTTV